MICSHALLAIVVAGSICVLGASESNSTPDAQSASVAQPAASVPASSAARQTTSASPSTGSAPVRHMQRMPSKSAEMYYGLVWGVDSLKVKYAESGEIIRFAYRVLDADKAKVLNDKRNEPSLIDPEAGVSLVIPTLPKVGKLRQSSTAESGKVYWMAFSNKGRHVKPGHRVNVAIGNFRAEGLIVE